MFRSRKKQALTLIEIMIVIVLIGLIGSVIGYNMKGSLEEGRAFKTEKAIDQIHDILMLEVAKGDATIDEVVSNPDGFLAKSNLVKDPSKLLKDGWGKRFQIKSIDRGQDISVASDSFDQYRAKQKAKVKKG
ncbi:MAG: type II secretion system GspH family protein [Rhabdochlamydiaceae bacterium]|nr:type II secretion system GspH family protein [Rhabdochlamydiaceae bacterium]